MLNNAILGDVHGVMLMEICWTNVYCVEFCSPNSMWVWCWGIHKVLNLARVVVCQKSISGWVGCVTRVVFFMLFWGLVFFHVFACASLCFGGWAFFINRKKKKSVMRPYSSLPCFFFFFFFFFVGGEVPLLLLCLHFFFELLPWLPFHIVMLQ